MSLLLRRPPGREAYPGDVGRPLVVFMDAVVGFLLPMTPQAGESGAGCRLTMVISIIGEKTQMGQEHACKGYGSAWSAIATTRAQEVCEKMSGLIANASCERTPGPIVRTTQLCLGLSSASWRVLNHRTFSLYQQEASNSVRMKSSGSAWEFPFSPICGAKLFGTVRTISMEPVNFARHYCTAEGRGRVVLHGKGSCRKAAKSVNEGGKETTTLPQGTARLTSCEMPRVSSNDEQVESGSISNTLNKLRRLGELSNHPINNLMKSISDFKFWIAAYAKLSRNPGSLTKGTDGRTIDGTSIAILKALQKRTLTGDYPWGSIRRTWIPKPGRTEKRPLGIPNFQDRVVQEVLRMILEAIYESVFFDCSHGFRSNRGQEGCIKYIRAWFPGTLWYIEGDISKCFDSIDHYVLARLLKKRIKDKKFIGLIESGLKSTIIDFNMRITSELGTPQGGVMSPLLSNIYMHEFDRYMQRVMLRLNKGKRRRANLEYQRLANRAYRARKRGDLKTAKLYSSLTRQLDSKDPMDPEYRRIRYVRFADDFLIGVIGPKSLTVRVTDAVNNFLSRRLKLKLNLDKTHITHHEERIPWLGFRISTSKTEKGSKVRLEDRTISQRSPTLGVVVYSDIQKILKRLHEKGYCQKDGSPVPNWREALLPPQSYSVERASKLIVGLDSYYRVANNRRATTHRVMRVIRNSLAKTYAAKYKLGTMSKVFSVAGKDLSKPLKSKKSIIGVTDEKQVEDAKRAGGDLLKAGNIRIPFVYARDVKKPDISFSYTGRGFKTSKDPYVYLNTRFERAHSALKGVCSICGATENIEMHHIRAIKDLKGKDLTERIMMAINRKQIPLCRPCHLAAHGKKTSVAVNII